MLTMMIIMIMMTGLCSFIIYLPLLLLLLKVGSCRLPMWNFLVARSTQHPLQCQARHRCFHLSLVMRKCLEVERSQAKSILQPSGQSTASRNSSPGRHWWRRESPSFHQSLHTQLPPHSFQRGLSAQRSFPRLPWRHPAPAVLRRSRLSSCRRKWQRVSCLLGGIRNCIVTGSNTTSKI